LFSLLDTNECDTLSRQEVIYALLQFKDLLPDLQIDKYVTINGIKPRDEDEEIDFAGFKKLIEEIVLKDLQ